MPTISGPTNNFHQSWRFFLVIDGITRGRFKSASEIAMEFETVEHSEGGTMIRDKAPGRLTVDDVTLERGVLTGDNDLYEWFLQSGDPSKAAPQGASVGVGIGLPNREYKRDVDIVQLDRDGTQLKVWRLHNAWVKRFVAGAWDNDGDENVIESVVLAYDYPTLV